MKSRIDTENSKKNNLRYPVILVHGAGFRDDSRFYSYWGRIPETMSNYGIKVFFSGQEAWGTIETNAELLKIAVLNVMNETGCKKVNLIAHSRGGLECRYLISTLKMDKSIASLTTISTPHHGSVTIDMILKLPKFILKAVAVTVNSYFRILGDRNPDFYAGLLQFSTNSAQKFNMLNQNAANVYYQSFAAKLKHTFGDLVFFIPHLVVRFFDGECDGICSVNSAKWGNFRGIIGGDSKDGISHADIVDYRKNWLKKTDIPGVYLQITYELAEMGF